MKVPSIIKKLNKSYSVVIIPNNNDSVKNISLHAPFAKVLIMLILILTLSTTVFITARREMAGNSLSEEASREALQQQVQTLSQLVTEQNKSLALNKNQIVELKANNLAAKNKIQQFTKMYSEIATDYISKASRGSTSVTNNKNVLDLMKLSSVVEELNRSFQNDEKLMSELEKTDKNLASIVEAIPTLIPAYGKISSPFGMRNHPIKKVNIAHTGVDISSSKGDPILAAATGVVEYSAYSKGYGYHVIIDHKNGYRTLYGHSSKLLVKKGELVKKGQTIALVGSTGVSTGPHLHFEIRIGNTPVDPTQYIDFSATK